MGSGTPSATQMSSRKDPESVDLDFMSGQLDPMDLENRVFYVLKGQLFCTYTKRRTSVEISCSVVREKLYF